MATDTTLQPTLNESSQKLRLPATSPDSSPRQQLIAAYSNLALALNQSLSAERLVLLAEDLSDLPLEQCLTAIGRWRKGTLKSRLSADKTRFLPTAHEIRAEIEFATGADYESMLQDGFDFILWYIPRHGFNGHGFGEKRDPQTDKIIDPGEPAPPVPPIIALTLENLGNGDIKYGFRAMAEHHRVPKPPGYQGDQADPEKLEKRWRKAFDRAWKAT